MHTNRIFIATTIWIATSFTGAQAGPLDTLKDIQASAVTVEEQADDLQAIAWNHQASLDAHLIRLMALKEALNKTGQEIHLLQNESPAPWQRQALAKATPLLSDAAANTQKAIEFYSENQLRLWTPEYHDYVQRISTDSTEAAKILKDHMNYERSRERENKLEQRIEGE